MNISCTHVSDIWTISKFELKFRRWITWYLANVIQNWCYVKWFLFRWFLFSFYFDLKKWTFHNWIIIQNYDHALFYQRDSAWITWFSIIYLKQNQLNWILRWWKSLRSGASHHSSKYSFCSCVAKRFNCR